MLRRATFPWRLIGVVVTLAVLGVFALKWPTQAPADGSEPAPVVTVQSDRSVRIDDAVRVSVARVTSTKPLTINWGDGTTTRVRSSCTPAQARTAPGRCGATARHAYKSAGIFRIKVSRARFSVSQAVMRVAGSVAAAAAAGGNWRLDMLAEVNALRAQVGVKALDLCGNLNSSAQDYASLMASHDHYGHVGPDGSQPWERMKDHGYNWRDAAENIAGGYADVSTVMAGWHESAGHYANIVNPDYTDVGFGSSNDPDSTYTNYWVQDFGSGGSCTD